MLPVWLARFHIDCDFDCPISLKLIAEYCAMRVNVHSHPSELACILHLLDLSPLSVWSHSHVSRDGGGGEIE